MISGAKTCKFHGHALVSALKSCRLLDVLVVAMFIRKSHFKLTLVQVALVSRKIMKRPGLPTHSIPGLFQCSMSAFSSLLQVASAAHLQVYLLLVVPLSLKGVSSLFSQGVEVLER